jgi:putative oxidoreductase
MSESLRFAPLLGRILIALLFLPSGFEKVSDFHGSVEYAIGHNLPLPVLGVGIALVIELLGSLLLVIGYKARWTAAIMAVYCIVAAVFFHNNFAEVMERINFFKDVAIAGGLLQIAYFGAGPLSVDNRK